MLTEIRQEYCSRRGTRENGGQVYCNSGMEGPGVTGGRISWELLVPDRSESRFFCEARAPVSRGSTSLGRLQ